MGLLRTASKGRPPRTQPIQGDLLPASCDSYERGSPGLCIASDDGFLLVFGHDSGGLASSSCVLRSSSCPVDLLSAGAGGRADSALPGGGPSGSGGLSCPRLSLDTSLSGLFSSSSSSSSSKSVFLRLVFRNRLSLRPPRRPWQRRSLVSSRRPGASGPGCSRFGGDSRCTVTRTSTSLGQRVIDVRESSNQPSP